MKTIRVTGRGLLRVAPDATRVTMTLEGCSAAYDEALRRSSEETEQVKALLSRLGFERTDLKTLDFRIDADYESYQDKEGVYRQRFVGYRFTHTMKVEFPSDSDRLGRVLSALASGSVRPEFRVSYTVSDPEGARNALLERAVADATEKAAALTRAGGVPLGDLQSIDYSWGRIDFEVLPRKVDGLVECCEIPIEAFGCAPDITPDDIEVSDAVTVVWEIGERNDP